MDDKDWLHKHDDGQGGVLNIAGNKTLLSWYYLMGQRQQNMADNKHEKSKPAEHDVSDNYKKSKHAELGVSDRYNKAKDLPLARGVAGLPSSKTPALVGAEHGSIQCPSPDGNSGNSIHMDELAYWNEPQGESDTSFVSPFVPPKQPKQKRYVTFEPDQGGWNNIRMSLEIVMVFAAATGRTLVLPPDTPFYLLTKTSQGKRSKHHGFADFLDLENEALGRKLNMITMNEFLAREGGEAGDINYDE